MLDRIRCSFSAPGDLILLTSVSSLSMLFSSSLQSMFCAHSRCSGTVNGTLVRVSGMRRFDSGTSAM
jgi:hypothetical protein